MILLILIFVYIVSQAIVLNRRIMNIGFPYFMRHVRWNTPIYNEYEWGTLTIY